MIAKIEGQLIELSGTNGLVKVGQVTYEILLGGYAISELGGKIGSDIELYTIEYMEGTPGKGNLIPRMVGFLSLTDKDFFAKYTSVKGLGIKKGLKSLTMPIATIANAIEAADEKMLMTLPSVGKRLAQLIIAELKGKVEDFAIGEITVRSAGAGKLNTFQLEALEILVAWGEKRNESMELIQLACRKHPDIQSAEELVPLAYRIKQGIEV